MVEFLDSFADITLGCLQLVIGSESIIVDGQFRVLIFKDSYFVCNQIMLLKNISV